MQFFKSFENGSTGARVYEIRSQIYVMLFFKRYIIITGKFLLSQLHCGFQILCLICVQMKKISRFIRWVLNNVQLPETRLTDITQIP